MNLVFAFLFAITPPCAQEDSTNCHWDAQHQGNHIGTSFVQFAGVTWKAPS